MARLSHQTVHLCHLQGYRQEFLFDNLNDPFQMTNLASDARYQEVLQQLKNAAPCRLISPASQMNMN